MRHILLRTLPWLGVLVVVLSFFVARATRPAQLVDIEKLVLFKNKPHAQVLFGGDMMFDRSIRVAAQEKGGEYLFSCLGDTLQKPDLVVANLEGPITDNPSVSVGSVVGSPENFRFTFPPTTAALLSAHNIKLVNLGNNHITNYGVAGVQSTMEYLRKAGVEYIGQPGLADEPTTQSVVYKNIRSVSVAFINYNEFEKSSTAALTVRQIQEARSLGFIPVVYTHWGVEYKETSPSYIQDLAHEFVDAGAEVVIGSHPHVVEEYEIYRGKMIYYSLGNFIFDQYFSGAVMRGLLLSINFTQEGVAGIQEIPVVLGRDRRTCLSS